MTNPNFTPPPGWPAMSIAQAHAMLTAPGTPLEMNEVVIRGVKTRVWKNLPPTLRELLAAARAAHGPKEFLVYEKDRATYESWYRAAVAIANELIKQGVKKGDRIALIMRNLPEWLRDLPWQMAVRHPLRQRLNDQCSQRLHIFGGGYPVIIRWNHAVA